MGVMGELSGQVGVMGKEKKEKRKWAWDNWVGLGRFWAWNNANGLKMTKEK